MDSIGESPNPTTPPARSSPISVVGRTPTGSTPHLTTPRPFRAKFNPERPDVQTVQISPIVNRELFPDAIVDVPVGKSPGYSAGSMADDEELTHAADEHLFETCALSQVKNVNPRAAKPCLGFVLTKLSKKNLDNGHKKRKA